MIVRVDVAAATAELDDPGNVGQFHVAASGGDTAAVAAVLGGAGAGADAGDAPAEHVWVAVDWVRAQASGRVEAGWDDQFAKMLDYAGSKGWLDGSRSAIQAHVEWA